MSLVTIRGIDLVRKLLQIKPGTSEVQTRQMKSECEVGLKLDRHRHIINLVGKYWKGPYKYNLLRLPVAVCDLDHLLDLCEQGCRRTPDVNSTEFVVIEPGMELLAKRSEERRVGKECPV